MKQKNFLIVFISLASIVTAQDMRQNSAFSLFSDNKAARQGDAVTIIVLESTLASNNSETSAGRQSDIGADLNAGANGSRGASNSGAYTFDVKGGGAGSIGTANDFRGSGSTKTTGMIRTKISAVVDTVLANGNLVLRGSKKISINGEDQIVNIKGVVRPVDIQPDNTVLSYNVTDAEISFEGSGLIDNAQKPGWLTKIFHWLF